MWWVVWVGDVIFNIKIQNSAQPTTTDSVYILNVVIIFCFSFCSVFLFHKRFLLDIRVSTQQLIRKYTPFKSLAHC